LAVGSEVVSRFLTTVYDAINISVEFERIKKGIQKII
jgi:hypothetical protein